MSLFKFFADNITNSLSMVEFSLAQTGYKGDDGLNFITTSHQNSKEMGMGFLLKNQLLNGYTIRTLLHSHPRSVQASNSDYKFAEYISLKLITRTTQLPLQMTNNTRSALCVVLLLLAMLVNGKIVFNNCLTS